MPEGGEGPSPVSTPALSQVSRWSRGLQALCFVGAGLTHVRDMWQGGWLPYHYVPLPINVFTTSLVVWGPLAAYLLLWRPRAGVALALLIMVVDVAVNSTVAAGLGPMDWYDYLPLQLQTLFLGFVAGSAPLIWLSAGRGASAEKAPGGAG